MKRIWVVMALLSVLCTGLYWRCAGQVAVERYRLQVMGRATDLVLGEEWSVSAKFDTTGERPVAYICAWRPGRDRVAVSHETVKTLDRADLWPDGILGIAGSGVWREAWYSLGFPHLWAVFASPESVRLFVPRSRGDLPLILDFTDGFLLEIE